MPIIQQIRECFLQASTDRRYHNKWLSDDAWRNIIASYYDFGFKDISKKNINATLLNTTLCHPLQLHNNRKSIYRLEDGDDENKKFKGCFYFIANELTTKDQLHIKLDWNDVYFNYELPVSNKNRKINHAGTPQSVSVTPLRMPPLPQKNDAIAKNIGSWWDSKEACKLFAPTSEGGDMKVVLSRRIDLLNELTHDPKKIKKYVNRAEECGLDGGDAIAVYKKILYLQKAYSIAIENIPKITWAQCCEQAIERLAEVNIAKISCERTLMNWNKMFRKNETFPHPKKKIEKLSPQQDDDPAKEDT